MQLISLLGPHTVYYNSPGLKFVSLTIETDLGCIVTAVSLVEIDSCCDDLNEIDWSSHNFRVVAAPVAIVSIADAGLRHRNSPSLNEVAGGASTPPSRRR